MSSPTRFAAPTGTPSSTRPRCPACRTPSTSTATATGAAGRPGRGEARVAQRHAGHPVQDDRRAGQPRGGGASGARRRCSAGARPKASADPVLGGLERGPARQPPSAKTTREQLEGGCHGRLAARGDARQHAEQGGGARRSGGTPSATATTTRRRCPGTRRCRMGHYLLDEHGNLKPEVREIIHLVADYGRALFFGHATHPEIFAMAEEVDKSGFTRAVVDHPFSPFVDLNVEQMQQLAGWASAELHLRRDLAAARRRPLPDVPGDPRRGTGALHALQRCGRAAVPELGGVHADDARLHARLRPDRGRAEADDHHQAVLSAATSSRPA